MTASTSRPAFPFPSLDPARPAFKRGKLAQAVLDVFEVGFAALFILATAAAIEAAFFIMFFVAV